MNNSFNTPKKPRTSILKKEERDTPVSQRSLRIDEELSQGVTSPAASSASNKWDNEEEMLENFWKQSGIEAASQIASRLASSAVMLAAKFTLTQMAKEREAASLASLGRVGWPRRKLPEQLLAQDVPASWRLSASRRAAALATPPRSYKRKVAEEDDQPFVDMLGIAPLTPVTGQLRYTGIEAELAALHKLDARERVKRAMERRLRSRRNSKRKEDDELALADYEDDDHFVHQGHGCEFEKRDDLTSDDEDDVQPSAASSNVNNGAVNVNILCHH